MIRIEGEIKNFSPNLLRLEKLVNFCMIEPTYFTILVDIMFRYTTTMLYEEEQLNIDIKDYLETYPEIQSQDYESFFMIIKDFYQLDQKIFRNLRGDVTEFTVTQMGPFYANGDSINILHEVYFKQDNLYIGEIDSNEMGKNMDVCFYEKDSFSKEEQVDCEVHECKIKLSNFIKPQKAESVEKIKYMQSLVNRFVTNPNFTVCFSTFSDNVSRERIVLDELGCGEIAIVTKRDIVSKLKKAQR